MTRSAAVRRALGAMRTAVLLAASPALAQANGNLPPGGVVDGAKAGINDAEGTAPDGKPSPGGRQGEGKPSATPASKMVEQGESGAQAPGQTPDKP